MIILHVRLPAWIKGVALTPSLILIDRRHKGDAVLLAHEREHCAEVMAYRVSYRLAPERIAEFATALSRRYRLGITFEQAVALIRSGA